MLEFAGSACMKRWKEWECNVFRVRICKIVAGTGFPAAPLLCDPGWDTLGDDGVGTRPKLAEIEANPGWITPQSTWVQRTTPNRVEERCHVPAGQLHAEGHDSCGPFDLRHPLSRRMQMENLVKAETLKFLSQFKPFLLPCLASLVMDGVWETESRREGFGGHFSKSRNRRCANNFSKTDHGR